MYKTAAFNNSKVLLRQLHNYEQLHILTLLKVWLENSAFKFSFKILSVITHR